MTTVRRCRAQSSSVPAPAWSPRSAAPCCSWPTSTRPSRWWRRCERSPVAAHPSGRAARPPPGCPAHRGRRRWVAGVRGPRRHRRRVGRPAPRRGVRGDRHHRRPRGARGRHLVGHLDRPDRSAHHAGGADRAGRARPPGRQPVPAGAGGGARWLAAGGISEERGGRAIGSCLRGVLALARWRRGAPAAADRRRDDRSRRPRRRPARIGARQRSLAAGPLVNLGSRSVCWCSTTVRRSDSTPTTCSGASRRSTTRSQPDTPVRSRSTIRPTPCRGCTPRSTSRSPTSN